MEELCQALGSLGPSLAEATRKWALPSGERDTRPETDVHPGHLAIGRREQDARPLQRIARLQQRSEAQEVPELTSHRHLDRSAVIMAQSA
jgi:hypothetical protein